MTFKFLGRRYKWIPEKMSNAALYIGLGLMVTALGFCLWGFAVLSVVLLG